MGAILFVLLLDGCSCRQALSCAILLVGVGGVWQPDRFLPRACIAGECVVTENHILVVAAAAYTYGKRLLYAEGKISKTISIEKKRKKKRKQFWVLGSFVSVVGQLDHDQTGRTYEQMKRATRALCPCSKECGTQTTCRRPAEIYTRSQ